MGKLPMVEKETPCSELVKWPLFYMHDFSVMGLLVQQLTPAVKALKSRGFQVIRVSVGAQISFNGPREMAQIMEALEREAIPFNMTDLVNHAYQG